MSSRKLDANEIALLIPQRDIALFIQSAEVSGMQATGTACWTERHPYLAGHFPDFPIVPGVFLVEAFAQLAGVVLMCEGLASAGKLGMLAGVRKMLIHRPVMPGETIEYHLSISQTAEGRFFLASGTACNPSREKVLTVDAMVSVVDRVELVQRYAAA